MVIGQGFGHLETIIVTVDISATPFPSVFFTAQGAYIVIQNNNDINDQGIQERKKQQQLRTSLLPKYTY